VIVLRFLDYEHRISPRVGFNRQFAGIFGDLAINFPHPLGMFFVVVLLTSGSMTQADTVCSQVIALTPRSVIDSPKLDQ